MLDLALPDDRHRLDPSMRVIREPGFVVRRTPRLEVVEQEEGVEMVESAGSEAPAEMHAGAFNHGLRRHELRHRARGLAHGWASLSTSRYRPEDRTTRVHSRSLAPDAGL